jgi:death-on-curing protein
MKNLTTEQVLFLHYRIIEETGGNHGVRDAGLLKAALARPDARFDNKPVYPNLFLKAGALIYHLLRDRPFVNGVECTAIAGACLYLLINGYLVKVHNDELERFAVKAATGNVEPEDIARWLKKHSVKVLKSR